jgi:hypothetical protein
LSENLAAPIAPLMFSSVTLGSEEIKVLIEHKDIKKFLDKSNLYNLIESK